MEWLRMSGGQTRSGGRRARTAGMLGGLVTLALLVLNSSAQAASIKAVQYGTATLAASSPTVTATLSPAVDLNRSFLAFSVSEDTASPEFGQVSGQITNGTTLTFSRVAAFGAPAITVKWYVAEFQSGVFVQRGSQNIASGGPTFNVTLPVAVTLSKSFPIISLRAVDTSYDDNDFIKAKITTTTNLELSASAPTPAGTRVVEWQVVQYQDANVQTGDVLFAGGIGSLPGPLAPAINTSKSWLLYTYDSASGTPANIGQKLVQGVITNGITLTFDRNNTGQAINLTWYLVEFTDATTVQRNSQAFTTAQTTLPVALTAVDRGRSIAAAGGYGGGGRSNYSAADNTGVGWFTLDITTPTNLQITRGLTGTATADVGWFVMSFTPTGCCALTTSATASLLTVDTADVRMVWNTASGGGLKQFYAKNEPNSTINRASDEGWYNLISTNVNDGTWWGENTAGAWTLLEATPTRVKLRQNHTYVTGGAGPGSITLERDWSVYGFPRLATREALGFDGRDLRGSQGIQAGDNQAAPPGACPGAGTFYCSGRPNPTPANPAPAGLVYLVTDEATQYSDMLGIPYTSPFFGRVAANGDFQHSWENSDGLGLPNTFYSYVYEPPPTIPTGAGTDTKFYLYYPFLAGLTSTGTEYQPYTNAYRTPDILTINGGAGSRWADAAEYTTDSGTDWYNQADAAYALDLNTTLGLNFDMDGSVPKQKPFFKIRQWRSLWAPGTMTVESVTQRRSNDFQADVKPVSRALFCTSGAGTCSGTITVLANGGLVGSANEYLADPVSGKNFLLDFLTPGGQHLYIGSDSKFRGINFSLATAGVGATANLQWQYWDGTDWLNDLEATAGFTPATSNFTVASGVISWNADPVGWATTNVNGGPSLYYVRAYLTAGAYTTRPTEKLIKTDILLLQHCANVTAAATTFVLAPPAPTAVTLAGFTATALDSAVRLSWETASELDNLGFHFYRAPSAEGPWTRITPSLIPGLGSSPEGKRYSWVDTGLSNGVTYFYRLEDVDRSGLATAHGPVSATPGASGGAASPPGVRAPSPEPSPTPAPRAGEASGWKSYGEPSESGLRVLRRSASSLTLELSTGGFYALGQADGSLRLHVPGFFELSPPGLPQVPTRRAWVEVPAGSQVRVASVVPSGLVAFRGLQVGRAGSPQATVENGTYRASFRRVPPEKLRRGLFPQTQAGVLETAFQGETKKAYLELAPLRVDEASGQVLLARKLVVRLVFQGRAAGERSRGGSRGRLEPGAAARRPAAAGRMLARLVARMQGLHAVSFDDVASGAVSGPLSSSWLRLSRLGQPVAFHVEPRADRFGPGSTLYFMAEDPEAAYGSETVYELALASGGVQMPVERSSRSAATTLVPALQATRLFETNTNYLPALLNARDLWFWDFGLLAPNGADYPFSLSSPSVSSGSAVLSLDLQGGSDAASVDPDHQVRVLVNGVPVGEARWDGLNPFHLETSLDASILREGANTLRLENLDTTGAFDSVVYLDRFAVQYPHALVAASGRLDGRAPSSGLVQAAGFSPGSVVLDLTSTPPRWLTPVVTGSGLVFAAEAQRTYLAVSPEAVLRPEIRTASASSLRNGSLQADWIVVAPQELLPAAEPLMLHRESQGLRAMAVSLEQARDEFGFGERSPQAIRDFLAHAYHHWAAPSPRYVLLLGDASSDPKGFLPTASRKDLLPSPLTKSTFLWTASDPSLGAVNGNDAIPDLAIGRITAGSLAEAQIAVQKILDFENASQNLAGNAVLVADNPDLAGDFEANASDIASLLQDRQVERIFLTELGSSTRSAVLNAFNTGASLLSYVGHGSQGVWASEGILRASDVALLQPQPRQPLLLTMTCSNGYFISPWSNALSERLVLAQDKGAIAAFSPSGLSLDAAAHLFHRALVQELEHGGHERLGDLVLAAQKEYADTGAFPELLSIYHLFADPALKVR